MRRGVYQDLVALIVEPHRRETDPFVQTDQTQSHSDRLIEQPFVLWIEITQARRLLALADRKLALLQAVSNTTKIGIVKPSDIVSSIELALMPRAINMEDQNSPRNNT